MKEPRLVYLIKKILNKTSTEKETLEADHDLLDAYHQALSDTEKLPGSDVIERSIQKNVLSVIHEDEKERRKPGLRKLYLRYAAAILIISCLVTLYYINTVQSDKHVKEQAYLQPGDNKAIIEDNQGGQVNLAEQKAGDTIQFGRLLLKMEQDGIISYKKKNVADNTPPHLVSLKTPKGGKFQINLEDGTKVWLNTESSIEFPEHFANDKRLVTIKGEAYFEVAESKTKPFIVQGDDFGVHVLGTKFNVSNKNNKETAKIALLQGSVQLTSKVGNRILQPGERANIDAKTITIEKFDPESEIAWKDNYFIFKNENIKSIMAELAQWYDAEIVFQGDDWNDVNFNIRISRRENIEEILQLMELTKSAIQFKIEGRRIYVIKK